MTNQGQSLIKGTLSNLTDIAKTVRTNPQAQGKVQEIKNDLECEHNVCDMKNTTRLLKYKPRVAHVKATLYKECRSICDAQSIIKSKEQLCPTVYIRTNYGWRTWHADEDKFTDVENITDDLSWIDKNICQFITENADEQRGDPESLKNTLENKPTLYWAVMQDDDVIDVVESPLKLESISATQVCNHSYMTRIYNITKTFNMYI